MVFLPKQTSSAIFYRVVMLEINSYSFDFVWGGCCSDIQSTAASITNEAAGSIIRRVCVATAG